MEWYHVLGIILGNFTFILPLWLWNRSEANADRRDILNLIQAIKDEMKDFHARLCVIEERNRK